jgi:diguanylate cyclase (GGDEF)-like protein
MSVEMSDDPRLIARSAAAIYAGAVVLQAVEQALPGGDGAAAGPGIAALVLAVALAVGGSRLPRRVVVAAGPIGVGLIAWALASTHGAGDGAVLYTWPVLWTAAFFGTAGAVGVVACVAVAHGVALIAMPASASVDRWLDVVAATAIVAGVVRFLAERNRRLVAQLAAEARTDPLTGLLNRRGLRERMDVELARAARDGGSIALIAFDVDAFKETNDEHGHEVGDRVLAFLGSLLASEVRGADIAARSGGDEFAVVLPDAGERDALAFADRIRRAFSQGSCAERQEHGVPAEVELSLSAGTACASGSIDEHLLAEAADHALYAGKDAGGDRVLSG